MSLVVLGDIEFEGFEVPAQITFGGGQQLAIHKLIGGARIIDTLGRDDASLSWSGVLSGSVAANRARDLDEMRSAGLSQALTWDAFSYLVVVSRLKLEFCSPWWIPYQITCAVQRDLAQSTAIYIPSTASSITGDLASAALLLGGQIPSFSASLSNYSLTDSSGVQKLETALVSTRASVDAGIEDAGSKLAGNDIGEIITSSGLLAALCNARGFLGRSSINLGNLEF